MAIVDAPGDSPSDRLSFAVAQDAVEQAGEAGVEVVAAERVVLAGAVDLGADDAGLAQHLEVVAAGRLARPASASRGTRSAPSASSRMRTICSRIGIAERLEHLDEVESRLESAPSSCSTLVHHAASRPRALGLLGLDHRVGLGRRLRAQQPRHDPRRHDHHDDRADPQRGGERVDERRLRARARSRRRARRRSRAASAARRRGSASPSPGRPVTASVHRRRGTATPPGCPAPRRRARRRAHGWCRSPPSRRPPCAAAATA